MPNLLQKINNFFNPVNQNGLNNIVPSPINKGITVDLPTVITPTITPPPTPEEILSREIQADFKQVRTKAVRASFYANGQKSGVPDWSIPL